MKKSTKIITTAVALALVMSFMVVGILAATSAAASITSSVNWTATNNLLLEFYAKSYFSAEHYDEASKSFPAVSSYGISKFTVDTTTTNDEASGIGGTLNATFIDDTDDGVNNPRSLYFIYFVQADHPLTAPIVTATKYPVSKGNVEVGYLLESSEPYFSETTKGITYEYLEQKTYTTTPETFAPGGGILAALVMRLTIKDPNTTVTNFDASIDFKFERQFT